ncbi:MAG TPA: AraC family transcriptional regulator [Iamia sp.]|nr:AraC family transcriptional regulator [Iamia sp.]
MPSGTRFPSHRHGHHQLSLATGAGALALAAEGRTWIVLPARALWIPAGVEHSVDALAGSEMTTLWLDPDRCPIGWDRTVLVAVDPLVALLVTRLLDPDLDAAARTRTEAVLFDVLEPVAADVLDLPLPDDDRARRVAEALLADPADDRTLAAWGRTVGASDRTLQRAFRSGTGLGFHEWRTRARVAVALRLLLTDRPIAAIAGDVGYATSSAFGAAFRRVTGLPPSAYRTPAP